MKPIIYTQKEVAKAEHLLFWNWFDAMGGDCSIVEWAEQGKARPGHIHLTAEGYQEIADILLRDISRLVDSHR